MSKGGQSSFPSSLVMFLFWSCLWSPSRIARFGLRIPVSTCVLRNTLFFAQLCQFFRGLFHWNSRCPWFLCPLGLGFHRSPFFPCQRVFLPPWFLWVAHNWYRCQHSNQPRHRCSRRYHRWISLSCYLERGVAFYEIIVLLFLYMFLVSICQLKMQRRSMCIFLCRYIPMHHLLQAELGCYAQLFSVFFNHAPELITLKRSKFYILYEILIHPFCMLSYVLQQPTNRISVVTSKPFDTSYTILLYEVFADIDYLFFRQMLVIERRVWSFNKISVTSQTKIPLVFCSVLSLFDYIFSIFLMIIPTPRIRASNIYYPSRSSHIITERVIVSPYIKVSNLGHSQKFITL